jgi:hypothetical protein
VAVNDQLDVAGAGFGKFGGSGGGVATEIGLVLLIWTLNNNL